MSSNRWTRWRRSLLVQLTALTVVIIVALLYSFAVAPLLEITSRTSPLERTRRAVSTEIFNAIYERDGASLATLEASQKLAEVAAINKNLHYFVRHGDTEVQFGGPPRWIEAGSISVPQPPQPAATSDPGDCATRAFWNATFDDAGDKTDVYYRECGGVKTFVEYAGIDTALPDITAFPAKDYLSILWRNARDLVYAGAGLILMSSLVLWFARRSLKRVISVARAFDPDKIGGVLPVQGIPTEVVPLVSAVNEMIGRVQESQDRQAFFLAAAAHEIRTPLAIVRNRLEELAESPAKDELRDDVRRLVALVEQLLRLMSIRNRDEVAGEVDLASLARTVIAERAPPAMEKNVAIEFEADVDSMKVKGDEALLNVALANLIDNAISFSSEGDTLTVRLDETCAISVQDQGPGIAVDVLDSVLEPFTKNPPNRKGHGLGLAIVQAIMKLHDGDVSAANVEGGGARFVLRFKQGPLRELAARSA